ncbi:cation:proton antiporter [Streptomyces sp. NPDC006422]|uniref:cation:proton antiporter n=1 Tax=unclassified Streptomyces TaxID=2593676 RepID=UPI0033A0083A
MEHPGTLILIMAAAVLAPLLAHGVGRWAKVPVVIFEIVLGIVIGPDVLGWAHSEELTDVLADLGLSLLIFLAGYEIQFDAIRGDTLRRAVWAWVISLVVGLAGALALTGLDFARSAVIGTALTSTALGTVVPLLRDSGDLHGRFGTVTLAFGAVGEFGPIIAMSVLLSGRDPGVSTVILAVFAAITAGAVMWALRPRPPWFTRVIQTTLHTSGQFAIRFVMLLLVSMLALSEAFGLDVLLGAFAAGLLTRLVLQGTDPRVGKDVLGKIEALGFGFLVPLFFIVTGIQFDLSSLLGGGRPLLLLPVFLVLFLVVRGLPVYALAPRDLSPLGRRALTLHCATCLPLVVAITTIGLDEGPLGRSEAAAMVGAAMVSVLVFPLLGLKLRGRERTGGTEPVGSDATGAETW